MSIFHFIPIFATGTEALWIAAISAVVGAGVSIASSVEQGRNARKMGKYQADQAEQDAINETSRQKMIGEEAAREADKIRQQRSRNMGAQVNAAAKSGLTISGSVLDTVFDSSLATENDIEMSRYRGEIGGFDSQAQGLSILSGGRMNYAAGQNASSAARGQAYAAGIGAVTSVAGSYAGFKGAKK